MVNHTGPKTSMEPSVKPSAVATLDPRSADEVPCKACGEQIRRGAVKCIHCDSFQNWRRHLNLSTNVLAMLIALVSVTSATLPNAYKSLAKDDSELKVQLAGIEHSLVNLITTNTGTRSGVVWSCQLNLQAEDGSEWSATLEPNFHSMIVQPGGTQAVVFQVPPVDIEKLLGWSHLRAPLSKRELIVSVREFSGRPRDPLRFQVSEAMYSRMTAMLEDWWKQRELFTQRAREAQAAS